MNKLRVLMEQPPPPRGDAEQQVAELRTYISRMVEELQFLFEHLDARATDYDPYDSGLLARNTQDAIDELTAGVQNVPTPYPNNPAMDGTAYPGASNSYARGDHVHPKDTSKANFDTEIIVVNMGTVSSLPKTVSNAKITADHVVIQAELGTPAAQTGDWTATTSAGSVTLSGTISGSTTVTLVLGNSGGTVS